ncbi:MAG: carboxypeptidase-like regulatory domain-containing protein [candidate division Zixibacteria bacterium]
MFTLKYSNKTSGYIFLICLLLIFSGGTVQAQFDNFEEIVVNFDIPRLLNKDIFVQYDGQTIFLPVIEIIGLLELKITHDQPGRRMFGYILSEDDKFLIDIGQGKIKTKKEEFDLLRDQYFYNGYELYLRHDLFTLCFNLNTKFDFSQLKVSLPLNKDFPAYQRLKRKQAQEKLMARREVEKKIYALPFKRAWFRGGVADWMIATNPIGTRQVQYFSLNTGSMVAGGDLMISGNGSVVMGNDPTVTGDNKIRNRFEIDDLRYKWHYFVANQQYISQIEAGNVFTGGRLSRALEGVLATNKPQVRRKHFQTIIVSDYIGEGWEIELYIDNRLIDFIRTDESGKYDFNIDIFYGASLINLKMYGPGGEIREKEINIKIPYNLIPKNEVEYTVAIGKDDNPFSSGIFGQANCFYGVTTRLTAGISADLPISTEDSSRFGFAGEFSYQPLTNLTFNGYASPGQMVNAAMTFSKPSIVSINGSFTNYLSKGYRNLAGRLQTYSISATSPIKIGGRRISLRCNTFVDRFPKATEINTYYGLSTSISRIYINYFGKYGINKNLENGLTTTDISSQLLMSTTLLRWIRPQIRFDYDHSRKQIRKVGVYLTKRVFRTGQISLSLEKNVIAKSNLIMATFTLYGGFASFNTRAVTTGDQIAVTQIQRGSIRYNQETNSFHFDRRAGVGQGSAVLRPFLDRNFNGRFDEKIDEIIPGLTAKIKGANGRLTNDGTVFYFDRLRAYDEYVVEINEYSLDDPLLKPIHEGYRMNFNPNMVTAIDVPIVMAGEINGSVKRQTASGQAGLGGAKIILVNLSTGERHEITTFNNGEFYYLGLIPGRYRAEIDNNQLISSGYKSTPEYIDFELKPSEQGAIVEDINFLLIPR